MEQYTIYCTEEQTKKALELGAPIDEVGYNCQQGYIYEKVTAEQMLGWLRKEKGIFVSAEPSEDWYYGTYRLQKESGFWTYEEFVDGYFETPEEATLAAIDAALDYLIKNKK